MGLQHYHNAGALIQVANAGVAPVTLSGTTNAHAVDGTTIDRYDYRQHFGSCTVIAVVSATSLADANHVSVDISLADSADGNANWNPVDLFPVGSSTRIVVNGSETGVLQRNYSLATAKRYLSVGYISLHATDATPNTAINLPTGDSASISMFLVFTGSDQDPANLATADLGVSRGNLVRY